jgi:superfamily II DNA or RNA helicase
MPTDELELLNTKAFLGPVLRDYSSGLLSEQGYISKCNVKVLNINYVGGIEAEGYNDYKEQTFTHKFRLDLIKDMVTDLENNILLLVGLKKEGNLLLNYLGTHTTKRVRFLHGTHDVEYREKWRQKMSEEDNIALIATYGIYQQGINIPNLKYLILAAPFKSKIRVLQSIGRTLRKHEDKSDGAYIFDLCDEVRYLKRHADKRIMFYESEGFEIEEINLNTAEPYDLSTLVSS